MLNNNNSKIETPVKVPINKDIENLIKINIEKLRELSKYLLSLMEKK